MKHISNEKINRAIKYLKNYHGYDEFVALGFLLIAIYDLLMEREDNGV
mgnify:FL=1